MRRSSPVETLLFGLVLVTGLLDATAIAKIGDNIVPAYWASDALAVLGLWIFASRSKGALITSRSAVLLAAAMLILFWLPCLLQVLAGIVDPYTVIKQFVARSALTAYFILTTTMIMTYDAFDRTMKILKFALLFYIGYGLFDYVGQLYGWPSLLEFMRLGASTFARGDQGWALLPRAVSLSAEPSYTTLPVAFTLYLCAAFPMRKLLRFIAIAATLLFAALTISRTLWIVIGAATAGCFAIGLLQRTTPRTIRAYLENIPAAIVLLLPIELIASLSNVSNQFSDSSASTRAGTTQVGVRLFLDHPLLGVGPNNFGSYFWRYSHGFFDELDQAKGAINSAMPYYLQAYGLSGMLLFYLPLLYLAMLKHLSLARRVWWLLVLTIDSGGVDIYYPPHVWLILAFLTAENVVRGGVPYRSPDVLVPTMDAALAR